MPESDGIGQRRDSQTAHPAVRGSLWVEMGGETVQPSFRSTGLRGLELLVERCRGPRPSTRLTALALACALALALPFAGGRARAADEGLRVKPSLGWSSGDHRLDLNLVSRFRTEFWDAHASEWDTFYALRTRVSAKYSFRNVVSLFAEFQDSRIYDLSAPSASGAGGLYRDWGNPGTPSRVHGDDLRQVWLELRPTEGLGVRIGRQDIKLGTQAMYKEGNWKYLKIKRASQRLVGTVGWTHGERSNDGVTAWYENDKHHVYGFFANPTTGVFDIDDAYSRQKHIRYGGVSWTAKRGTWLDNTEIRSFFLGYSDQRAAYPPGDGNGLEIYTLGFSAIGIYPMGAGNADLLIWTAVQFGDYGVLDHLAAAGVVEAGYQFTDVPTKPWLRAGINIASGDGDASDGDHGTFFNMLPTNHLYYGFADRLAFQNLMDLFAQLKLKPHERVGVDISVHHFRLVNDDDAKYFGTGAFTRGANFGIGANAPTGDNSFGTEIDAVVSVSLCPGMSLAGGYSRMWGHDFLNTKADENVDFAFLQLTLKY